MTQLIATSFIEDPNGSLTFRLNDEEILREKGKVKLDLIKSSKYYISWFVRGKYGSNYSISISSPKEAQLQITRIIGKSGIDFSFFEFRT